MNRANPEVDPELIRRPFYAAFAKGVLSGIILVSPAHEQPRPFLPPHD